MTTRLTKLVAVAVLLGTLGFFGCSKHNRGNGGTGQPNIIFIMTDDHTEQAVSSFGSELIDTPNIDRIAEEGMRFENSFVTNSLCAPSRAVMLTGKYSHLNGKRDNLDEFDGSQVTFPKLLQAAGYQTAARMAQCEEALWSKDGET